MKSNESTSKLPAADLSDVHSDTNERHDELTPLPVAPPPAPREFYIGDQNSGIPDEPLDAYDRDWNQLTVTSPEPPGHPALRKYSVSTTASTRQESPDSESDDVSALPRSEALPEYVMQGNHDLDISTPFHIDLAYELTDVVRVLRDETIAIADDQVGVHGARWSTCESEDFSLAASAERPDVLLTRLD
jgi:hypothetical protein